MFKITVTTPTINCTYYCKTYDEVIVLVRRLEGFKTVIDYED